MSLIDFESSNELKNKRNEEKEMRERILEKAKDKFLTKQWKEEQAKKRGENVWMLPSVSAKLESKSSKHKKKKKKKKKYSSSESGSEEDDKPYKATEKESTDEGPVKRDQWMEVPSLFQTYSKDEMQIRDGTSRKLKALEERKRKEEANKPGSHSLELNPHFKDGGSGLPQQKTEAKKVPVFDASWLRRALERAKTQAADEGKTLEEVATLRWGSLETFHKLLEEAERNQVQPSDSFKRNEREEVTKNYQSSSIRSSSREPYSHRSTNRDNRRRDDKDRRYDEYRRGDKDRNRSKDRRRTDDSEDERMRRKKRRRDGRHSSEESSRSSSSETDRRDNKKESRPSMLRPSSDDESKNARPSSLVGSSSRTSNWKKRSIEPVVNKLPDPVVEPQREPSLPPPVEDRLSSEIPKKIEEKKAKILTDKELNQLAAKLTKAELMGDEAAVCKLKKKLEKARTAREDQGTEMNSTTEEVVILTRTDATGFIRPAASVQGAPLDKQSRKKKAPTHGSDGLRDRYFADDDNYDLKTMFEKEKTTSVDDEIAMFHKGVCSNAEKLSEDFDVDDLFMTKVAPKEHSAKQQERDRKMAIAEHHRTQKSLETCHFCIDSKLMKKHLIVSLGTKCYLSVPFHESLREGHCLIAPLNHISCATKADEDLWAEMNSYRQSLVRMFESRDEDCVFFETAINLRHHPHMVIECVPLPKEIGDVAPIYFKKAILECEEEWAQNKKLIDLQGRNVRKAVPAGLPYFAVDFGMSPGYAHVIENETTFGKTFAQEILGGMLDIDVCVFRRPKPQNFENQRTKVLEFSSLFEPFDQHK